MSLVPYEKLFEAIKLDLDSVTLFRAMLNRNVDELTSFQSTRVPQGAFGGSSLGGELALHTAKAEKGVTDAILKIASGLQGFEENLELHAKDTEQTDTDQASVFQTFTNATDCVTGNDFTTDTANNNQCTLPPAGEDS